MTVVETQYTHEEYVELLRRWIEAAKLRGDKLYLHPAQARDARAAGLWNDAVCFETKPPPIKTRITQQCATATTNSDN